MKPIERARVLVVDAVPSEREKVIQVLEEEFACVGQAGDGVETVEMAVKLRPDYIVLDLVLPGMSGIAATEEILKQLEPKPRVVILTRLRDPKWIARAMFSGASEYLFKPLKGDPLREILRLLRV